jgi:hypothetical protein
MDGRNKILVDGGVLLLECRKLRRHLNMRRVWFKPRKYFCNLLGHLPSQFLVQALREISCRGISVRFVPTETISFFLMICFLAPFLRFSSNLLDLL